MSAGLATIRKMTPEVFQKLDSLGDRLRNGINRVFDEAEVEAQAVGTGSLFSIHFTGEEMTNYRNLAGTDKVRAKNLFLSLLNKGQYLTPGLIMCACSAAMNEAHIDGLVEAVEECFSGNRAQSVRGEK